MWADPDGLFETFKGLWVVHPQDRGILMYFGFLCALCTPVVLLLHKVEVLEDWGKKKIIGQVTGADIVELIAGLAAAVITVSLLSLKGG